MLSYALGSKGISDLFPLAHLSLQSVVSAALALSPPHCLWGFTESLGAVPALLSDSQNVGAIPAHFWLQVQSAVLYGLLCELPPSQTQHNALHTSIFHLFSSSVSFPLCRYIMIRVL